MKKLFVIFLLLTIFSCTNKNENEIPIFNGITFQLNEGESLGTIDTEIKDRYTELFNNSTVQIPLFKYIKHKDYQIFIGLPYNTSIEEMIQDQLNREDSLIANLKFESDSIAFFKEYEKNNFHLAEYAGEKQHNSLIFISTISDSTVFNRAADLAKRINLKD